MKSFLLVLVFSIGLVTVGFCQLVQRGDKIEALKIAYITKQLSLSPDEAKSFWPVYTIYEAEQKKTLKDHRQSGGTQLELDEKMLNLHKKHKPEFLKVIGQDKFDILMRAENSLRDIILKELQRRNEAGKYRANG